MEWAQGPMFGISGGYYWRLVDRLSLGFNTGRWVSNKKYKPGGVNREASRSGNNPESEYKKLTLLRGLPAIYDSSKDIIRELAEEHHQAIAMIAEK